MTLLKPCQADGNFLIFLRLDQDGTVTAQLILSAGKREELPQLEKPFTAASAREGPFQQQVPVQLGAVRESLMVPPGCAAAMLCPCSPPASPTAGALCISTCCCWGQRLAGLRCYYLCLAGASCVCFLVPDDTAAPKGALPQCSAVLLQSHTARSSGKGVCLSLEWLTWCQTCLQVPDPSL